MDPCYFESETGVLFYAQPSLIKETNFFQDLELLVQQFKYIRDLKNTEPWKSGVVGEVAPGLDVSTDDQIKSMYDTHRCWFPSNLFCLDYIKDNISSTWRELCVPAFAASLLIFF